MKIQLAIGWLCCMSEWPFIIILKQMKKIIINAVHTVWKALHKAIKYIMFCRTLNTYKFYFALNVYTAVFTWFLYLHLVYHNNLVLYCTVLQKHLPTEWKSEFKCNLRCLSSYEGVLCLKSKRRNRSTSAMLPHRDVTLILTISI